MLFKGCFYTIEIVDAFVSRGTNKPTTCSGLILLTSVSFYLKGLLNFSSLSMALSFKVCKNAVSAATSCGRIECAGIGVVPLPGAPRVNISWILATEPLWNKELRKATFLRLEDLKRL